MRIIDAHTPLAQRSRSFAEKEKFPGDGIFCLSIAVDFKSAVHFCPNGVDATEHGKIANESDMIQKMNDRSGKFQR
jgi:hypothetical protein